MDAHAPASVWFHLLGMLERGMVVITLVTCMHTTKLIPLVSVAQRI